MLRLGVCGAAMLAEPAVTEIEEVIGLIHGKTEVSGQRSEVGEHESNLTSDF